MSITYARCPQAVADAANSILCRFETHKPLLDARVKIDFLFAANEDGPAIMHHGQGAIGLCRKLGLKDRAAGRGDAEILIDLFFWNNASAEEQDALLDHELHHIDVAEGKRDDLGRPVIRLRKHDVQVGWFALIARRHQEASEEWKQGKWIFDNYGQAFWPWLMQTLPTQPTP